MQEIFIHNDTENNKTILLVENGKLIEKYEENDSQHRTEGNIYIGKVEDVLPGMQAAFVNIGEEKNTFIHIRDIIPKVSNKTGNKNEVLSKHSIKKYIKPGMPILVQVKRDSTDKKGARVSTHINFPGRFIVLIPDAEFITISQKIENEKEKERLTQIVKKELPEGFGAIIRTSANEKEEEFIRRDIQSLLNKNKIIQDKYSKIKKQKNIIPELVYENNDIITKLLNDVIDQEVERIITNDDEMYSRVQKIVEETQNQNKIKIEKRDEDILQIYSLQTQIEKVKNRKIWLKCGGFITIDKTEALTAIDVNSGKYVGNKDLEQTVFTVNKEATIEIAKQLRLRDIGGIIIIDYIDMEKKENKDKITQLLKESLKKDRSKTQVIGFTALDLLEMTRKHICSNS